MSTGIDARLAALGIELPPVSKPVANYLGCKRVGDLLYVGGHGPVTARGITRGKVGGTVSVEEARDAAKATALSMLATVRAELGTLDRVLQVIKVLRHGQLCPRLQPHAGGHRRLLRRVDRHLR